MEYIWLVTGFLLLIKGADFFVEGSSSLAKLLRVPSIIIGLTIVAFGTSAPELAVSLSASLAGNNDMAIGNVIGSNVFNLLVVIGACNCGQEDSIRGLPVRNLYGGNHGGSVFVGSYLEQAGWLCSSGNIRILSLSDDKEYPGQQGRGRNPGGG